MAGKSEGGEVRFRQFTLSAKCKNLKEERILAFLHHFDKGIKGFAYCKHDKDTYTEADERESKKRAGAMLDKLKADTTLTDAERAEKEAEARAVVVRAGDHKEDHWHLMGSFGTNAKSVGDIAEFFGVPENLVCCLRGGKKGFANMLAYLTHITPKAREEKKQEYPYEIVKGLRFPKEPAYEGFQNYGDFADAFERDELMLDANAVMVMKGKITPEELKKANPEYYLNNIQKVTRARLEYVNSLPTPDVLFNFYVGAMRPKREGEGGRIGKGLACQVLAVSHLRFMFPDIDFSEMSLDDLQKKYVFFAGAEGVTFDGYDGQPIIIWEDVRGYDLVKLFGGVGRLFKALDTHPKPMNFNVKYGKVMLKNKINIFNGVETYNQFISALSQEYKKSMDGRGGFETKEDMSQAQGRFPFFLEISPSFITAEAQLDYLIGTSKYNFRRTFNNNLLGLVQHNKLFEDTAWLGGPYNDAEAAVGERAGYIEALPETPCAEVFGLEEKYDRYLASFRARVKDERWEKPMDWADWLNDGQPEEYVSAYTLPVQSPVTYDPTAPDKAY